MTLQETLRRALPAMAGLALFSLFFAPPSFAQSAAQDAGRLTSMSIEVRPEFDQPNVLVIYYGELAAKDNLPQDVSVLLPKDAQLSATAYVNSTQDLINTDPATTKDTGDGYTNVTFKVPTTQFQVEFYYNPLQGSPDKTMDFVYKSEQAADQVQLQIQEPLKAENFTTVPASIVQTSSAHNFKYHVFDYSSVTAGQVINIHVSYRKTDPNPSMQYITPPTGSDTTSSSAASILPTTLVPAVLAVAFGLSLLALAGFAMWRRRQNDLAPLEIEAPAARRRSRKSSGPVAGFCSQCGRAITADDNFCPRCGTPRRVLSS